MPDPLLEILARWRGVRALVVGDFMLDQHLYGDAERLSADAPVPILRVHERDDRPGGAANVCLDLVALRCEVQAFGVIGRDDNGRLLSGALEASGVGAAGLIEDPARPTTVKQNLVGRAQARHPQKMFRVDIESRDPLSAEVERSLVAAIAAGINEVDLVCIEDYGKGVCTLALCRAVIDAAKRAGKPVFVDPARGRDYSIYRGATCLTPNRTEAEEAAGMPTCASATPEHNAELAAALMKTCAAEAIVLTLDRHGALVLERGKPPATAPTVAREVYDVTGAGDMFLAAIAAARGNGAGWLDAARFANAAAGLEVEVFGVQPIPFEQVHHAVVAAIGDRTGARSLEDVMVEVRARRARGERIVFTNGCFDILHTGHVSILERARAEGEFVVVGLNDDASVRRLKGAGRPVNTQRDRARVLAALGSVGAVVLFGDDTPIELIRAIEPDVLVKGADYTKDQVVGADVVEARGGHVVLAPLVAGRSSSGMIERLGGKPAVSGSSRG